MKEQAKKFYSWNPLYNLHGSVSWPISFLLNNMCYNLLFFSRSDRDRLQGRRQRSVGYRHHKLHQHQAHLAPDLRELIITSTDTTNFTSNKLIFYMTFTSSCDAIITVTACVTKYSDHFPWRGLISQRKKLTPDIRPKDFTLCLYRRIVTQDTRNMMWPLVCPVAVI